MPAIKDSNIVKIAVEMTNQVPNLTEFNQKQPLTCIIQELCNQWGLAEPEQYALQFNDNNNRNYITEKNRNEVKNGSVLRLEFSPLKTAQDILHKFTAGSPEDKAMAIQKLSKLSSDITFALEFINKQGLTLIIKQIEAGNSKGTVLAHTLLSFVELMEHGIVSWEILDVAFINRVAGLVNTSQDEDINQAALSILENVVLNHSQGYEQVEREVPVTSLITHLQETSVVQQNTVALINALLTKADYVKRKSVAATLISKQLRVVIQNNIIQTGAAEGAEMAHQLYVLQTLILGLFEQRMVTKMDPQDQDGHDKIKELRKIAFDSEGAGSMRGPGGFTRDYKKLGFKNDINPALDFTETPPGLLALDCMVYFARNHPDNYTKLVLENSCRADEHECPFGRASVELVKILCELLKIGEPPAEQGATFQPLFFANDYPFEETFCICIVLLNKTWKEMRATSEDFGKVASVVREQIIRALQTSPLSLEQLRQRLQSLTYSEITSLWQQERTSREEWESHARPIVELREQITPDILNLITQQRLTYLVEGTRFTKYSARGQRIKDKFWFMRLSPNHKVLHYGDCDEKSAPSAEELASKLAVSDIKALYIGKDCPHMRGRKASHQLAFSLALEGVDLMSLDCVAPDELAFAYWTDGINGLLGNKMQSKETEKDLDTLLSMEIKLRLLDAEGVTIPQDPPIIPPDPPHYSFYYELQ
ncbi:PREDICTED: engulfment and cell motility protein 1 [Nicrophorus vespilloides]|uniref:Engulfment and cell motility protein 1 n=1 Tax=Nicrophorus vespilloides TaxID=110193 RepID=A0ABM1MU02_NICVS|nr:PREDICTED: engulfment and cell motility protein 1 [Nicrophorus vespilloides]